MATFTYTDAVFIGTVLEGLFFGMYLVLLVLFFAFETKKRKQNRARSGVFYATIFLAVLCFLFFSLDFFQQYEFVANRQPAPKDSLLFNINLATSALYGFIDATSQAILIYRCWIVWQRRYIVILVPGFLSLAGLALTLAVVYGLQTTSGPDFPYWTTPVGTTGFSLSLAVNTVVTCLIVTKIWTVSRQLKQSFPHNNRMVSVQPLIAALIESGMLTFIAQLVWVILFTTVSVGLNLVAGMITAVYGMTPTILAIRLVLEKSYPSTSEGTMTAASQDRTASNNVLSTNFTTVELATISQAKDKSRWDLDADKV